MFQRALSPLPGSGGSIPKITSWKSFSANEATSFDIDFKPKEFILVVCKPSDTTGDNVAFYTNINPTSGEIDTSGKWWRMWSKINKWIEQTTATYSLTDTSFTTSVGLSGFATKQGLIYF